MGVNGCRKYIKPWPNLLACPDVELGDSMTLTRVLAPSLCVFFLQGRSSENRFSTCLDET